MIFYQDISDNLTICNLCRVMFLSCVYHARAGVAGDRRHGGNGLFPQVMRIYNRNVDGMEDKILALYVRGMSQRDIAEQIKGLYDVEISPELVTKIREKLGSVEKVPV